MTKSRPVTHGLFPADKQQRSFHSLTLSELETSQDPSLIHLLGYHPDVLPVIDEVAVKALGEPVQAHYKTAKQWYVHYRYRFIIGIGSL